MQIHRLLPVGDDIDLYNFARTTEAASRPVLYIHSENPSSSSHHHPPFIFGLGDAGLLGGIEKMNP